MQCWVSLPLNVPLQLGRCYGVSRVIWCEGSSRSIEFKGLKLLSKYLDLLLDVLVQVHRHVVIRLEVLRLSGR